jgi:hypothetical protein
VWLASEDVVGFRYALIVHAFGSNAGTKRAGSGDVALP